MYHIILKKYISELSSEMDNEKRKWTVIPVYKFVILFNLLKYSRNKLNWENPIIFVNSSYREDLLILVNENDKLA
jgi:hypothetical protein